MATRPSAGAEWSGEFLDSMRAVGDPMVDELVRRLVVDREIQSVGQLIRWMADDGSSAVELPRPVNEYLASPTGLPPWADSRRIHQAQRFFEDRGFFIFVVLACYSLPASFAAGRGVQVVYRSGGLQRDWRERLTRTAQMVAAIMSVGGLDPGGDGLVRLRKVRLLHSAVRYLILTGAEPWNPEMGTPVNQEDLAGTLMLFSTLVLEGLEKLGMAPTREEAEAYLQLWNVAGSLIGIVPDLLPTDVHDARALTRSILPRNFAPSDEGRALTTQLLAMMEENTPIACKGLARTMMRHFLGDEISTILDLPESDWTGPLFRQAVALHSALNTMGRRFVPLNALLRWARPTHEYGVRLLQYWNDSRSETAPLTSAPRPSQFGSRRAQRRA